MLVDGCMEGVFRCDNGARRSAGIQATMHRHETIRPDSEISGVTSRGAAPVRALLSPGMLLLLAVVAVLVAVVLVVTTVSRQPWLGLQLVADPLTDSVQVRATDAGHALPALPLKLVALQVPGGEAFALKAGDLVEEPDTLGNREAMDAFFERQGRIHAMLASDRLGLVVASAGGGEQAFVVTPGSRRQLSSVPAVFWLQLLTGAGGFLIGCWVLALRPHDAGVRCFALTGVGLMLAAFAAAIYSVRELALPAGLFRGLSILNHLGAAIFIGALVALFLLFPRPLVRARWLALIPVVFLPWWLLESVGLLSTVSGSYLPTLLQVVFVLGLLGWQWRINRGQPLPMAALRWLGLASLLTVVLLVITVLLPTLLEEAPVVSQGHAIGIFLILYAGLALGLVRNRIFDLDRWAFYLLLWMAGAMLLLALDLVLVLLLHLGQSVSLTLALLISAFFWLPLRGWLWRRLVDRRAMSPHEKFRRVLDVALAPGDVVSQERWVALLGELFAPLATRPGTPGLPAPAIRDDGLGLELPAVGRVPALRLDRAERGRRLFSSRDLELAEEVLEILRYASGSRDAYNEGAREERGRIARDLHDDVGSRLLTGLHRQDLDSVRASIRDAITEMGTIINGLSETEITLDTLLADLRYETGQRLSAANIDMDWPHRAVEHPVALDYRHYRNYLSVLRELVSNILRHAGARQVTIDTHLAKDRFVTTVADDGVGFQGVQDGRGHGLANLQHRIAHLGGEIVFAPAGESGGTRVTLSLPLPAAGD